MIYKDPKGLQKYQFTKVSQPIQTLSPKIQNQVTNDLKINILLLIKFEKSLIKGSLIKTLLLYLDRT